MDMLREDCLLKNGSGTNIAKADELAESDMDMSFDRGSVEYHSELLAADQEMVVVAQLDKDIDSLRAEINVDFGIGVY